MATKSSFKLNKLPYFDVGLIFEGEINACKRISTIHDEYKQSSCE